MVTFKKLRPLTVLFFATLLSAACSTAPESVEDRADLESSAKLTVDSFKRTDAGLSKFFDKAHGYAVFPQITKGGLGVGGAFGRGVVFSQGNVIGYCSMSQGTIGLQIGGQGYSQVIFFETAGALDRMTSGNFAFSANASAVAAKEGASATADYENGVAVFTLPLGGLMGEASVGGQNFSYEKK